MASLSVCISDQTSRRRMLQESLHHIAPFFQEAETNPLGTPPPDASGTNAIRLYSKLAKLETHGRAPARPIAWQPLDRSAEAWKRPQNSTNRIQPGTGSHRELRCA